MSLVIEGPSLSGKDFAAKQIGWPKFEKCHKERGQDSFDTCMLISDDKNIWVRWWLTEYVYGKYIRMEPFLTIPHLWHLGLLGGVKGVVQLQLESPSFDELLQRKHIRINQITPTVPEIRAADLGYKIALESLHRYLPPTFSTIEHAVTYFHRIQRRAKVYSSRCFGWGTLRRNCYLFVGDQPTLEESSFNLRAFQSPCGTGDNARFLFHTLHDLGLRPDNVHMIDSMNKDGEYPEWKWLMDFLQPTKVIALGVQAKNRLRKVGIPHITLPHPAYQNRYKKLTQSAYTAIAAKELGNVIAAPKGFSEI